MRSLQSLSIIFEATSRLLQDRNIIRDIHSPFLRVELLQRVGRERVPDRLLIYPFTLWKLCSHIASETIKLLQLKVKSQKLLLQGLKRRLLVQRGKLQK